MTNNLLIVRVADLAGLDYTGLRDDILESIRLGVLILGQEDTLEVMELPQLGQMEVLPAKEASPTEPDPEPDPNPEKLTEAEEKQAILQRLKDYRAAHGRGCLDAVARATRTKGRINDNTLRMLITGDTLLPIGDWRRIGRALERMEENSRKEVETCQ